MVRRGIVLSGLAWLTLVGGATAQTAAVSGSGSKPTIITAGQVPGSSSHSGGNGNCPNPDPPRCPPVFPPILIGWSPWVMYPIAPIILTPPVYTLPIMPWEVPLNPPAPFVPQLPVPSPVVRRPLPALRPRNRDRARSNELLELGDRLFRAGNYVRAVERYEQAIRADNDRAAPRARLAQVALVRGRYQDAANRLREAQAAEPGWLATAGNVQDLYPEPAIFAKHVATLEAHLQVKPEDRDAWLVLGALWYLSGRTEKSADVFLRLSDRREDPTLRAFLQATKADISR